MNNREKFETLLEKNKKLKLRLTELQFSVQSSLTSLIDSLEEFHERINDLEKSVSYIENRANELLFNVDSAEPEDDNEEEEEYEWDDEEDEEEEDDEEEPIEEKYEIDEEEKLIRETHDDEPADIIPEDKTKEDFSISKTMEYYRQNPKMTMKKKRNTSGMMKMMKKMKRRRMMKWKLGNL